jgi:hypothetical protein
MSVDSFKFLPRLIATYYRMSKRKQNEPIPWTPLSKPLSESKFALITTGGLYHVGVDEPFDLERERREPRWGDPTFRILPSNIAQSDLGVSHLHYNPKFVLEDINVLLPTTRFGEFKREGRIQSLAENCYSFMGYQGFPPNTEAWQASYGPAIAEKMLTEAVDCVLLTPA